jgi:hypothetical protein
MTVSSFNFDEDGSVVEWEHDGGKVLIHDVRQACFDVERNFIAVLPMSRPKESLNILNESGRLEFILSPPSGYLFEYLLPDASRGVRVICSAEDERGDILDWYFRIDLSSRELVKQGRAY